MKYSGAKNEIVIESARHPYEMCNEISRATFEKLQWNIWKFHNEILWISVEKSKWNPLGNIWKIAMKYWNERGGGKYENQNEIVWAALWKQWGGGMKIRMNAEELGMKIRMKAEEVGMKIRMKYWELHNEKSQWKQKR